MGRNETFSMSFELNEGLNKKDDAISAHLLNGLLFFLILIKLCILSFTSTFSVMFLLVGKVFSVLFRQCYFGYQHCFFFCFCFLLKLSIDLNQKWSRKLSSLY